MQVVIVLFHIQMHFGLAINSWKATTLDYSRIVVFFLANFGYTVGLQQIFKYTVNLKFQISLISWNYGVDYNIQSLHP